MLIDQNLVWIDLGCCRTYQVHGFGDIRDQFKADVPWVICWAVGRAMWKPDRRTRAYRNAKVQLLSQVKEQLQCTG
jgi:hypothetical protein